MSSMDPVIALGVGAWVWKEFGKDIVARGFASAKSRWGKFKWPIAEKRYKDRISDLYSTTRILYQADTVSLSDLYVDLFVLEKPEAFRRYGAKELASSFDSDQGLYASEPRRDALEMISQYSRLFVLGKPGSGKTTLLKYVALKASEGKIDSVPIFISFNNWAYSQKTLFEFIIEQFDICGFPDADQFIKWLLNSGNAIILFDGLDEVSEEGNVRGQMTYELENLAHQYPENKFIITCRNAANDYQFEGFTYVEIADLSDKQVGVFANKWFKDKPLLAEQFLDEMGQEDHQSLRRLSHNPLLLGMLCLVFGETSRFPANRGEVYRDAIDALVKKWDSIRGIRRDGIPGFSPEAEKRLLSAVAYDYFVQNKIFFEQDDLQARIAQKGEALKYPGDSSEAILNAVEAQHGLLVQRARRVYSFSHLTFQEYFAARYITENPDAEGGPLSHLLEAWNSPRWREVMVLTASLLPDADTFLMHLLAQLRMTIGKHRLLRQLGWSNALARKLQDNEDLLVARMIALALLITLSEIKVYFQSLSRTRDNAITGNVANALQLNDDVSKATLQELLTAISQKASWNLRLQNKLKELCEIFVRDSREFDESNGPINLYPQYLDLARVRIREQLKIAKVAYDQRHMETVKHDLKYSNTYLGVNRVRLHFRISVDYAQDVLQKILQGIENTSLPEPFSSPEDWDAFALELFNGISPHMNLSPEILKLSASQLEALEKFLTGNILLLDCLQVANVSDYDGIRQYIFSISKKVLSRRIMKSS